MNSLVKDAYDVIVAGGGPGGSSVAKSLAEAGHSVLMLEKRQEIGAPKRCGEGLSVASAEAIGDIPASCICRKINGAKVYSPDRHSIVLDFGAKSMGCVVERKMLDKWLAFEASRAGATVIAKSEVTGVIRKGGRMAGVRAIVNGGEEREIACRVLVAADGIESTVARKAGLDTSGRLADIDSGFQYEMCNLRLEDDRKITLYFGNSIAPRGYIWIFPKGKDIANVGIGTALSERPPKFYLDAFIDANPSIFSGSSIIEVNSGGIPVGGLLDDMVADGLVAVGDAAHQVNPIHGGGLKEATIAGRIASRVISKGLKSGDLSKKALSEYNRLWWEERGKKLKKVEKLRNVVEKLTDDDLNMLARELKGETLMELSRGNKLAAVAKVLMKKPSLIMLARHLI